MKFTSHITVITSNYGSYCLYEKGREPSRRRLVLHIIELESYDGQIIKVKNKNLHQIGGT